jgi:hypothetical protein
MPPHPLLELGGEALDPAIERDVVHLHAAVGQHVLEIAVADRELQVPPDRPEDDLGREAEAAEEPGVGHGWRERRSYPLTGRRSTQRNPFVGRSARSKCVTAN